MVALIIREPSDVIESELTARAPAVIVTPPAVTVKLSAKVNPPVALKSVPALPMFWIRFVFKSTMSAITTLPSKSDIAPAVVI